MVYWDITWKEAAVIGGSVFPRVFRSPVAELEKERQCLGCGKLGGNPIPAFALANFTAVVSGLLPLPLKDDEAHAEDAVTRTVIGFAGSAR